MRTFFVSEMAMTVVPFKQLVQSVARNETTYDSCIVNRNTSLICKFM